MICGGDCYFTGLSCVAFHAAASLAAHWVESRLGARSSVGSPFARLRRGLRMRPRSMPPYGAGCWCNSPVLLPSGGVWLNSASPQTTPALIRPPLRCSAAPKGGTERSPLRRMYVWKERFVAENSARGKGRFTP